MWLKVYNATTGRLIEEDFTTRLMLEEILSDEEVYANTWETVLGRKK